MQQGLKPGAKYMDTQSHSKNAPLICPCCGGMEFSQSSVIWPELAAEWRLSPVELKCIDEQQGSYCRTCGTNFRSMALAAAISRTLGYSGMFSDIAVFLAASGRRVLEINPAGSLTRFLSGYPGHVLATYPAVDITRLPYPDASFDLVIHSDTLEHIRHPERALAECRRVLTKDGYCIFTVPILVDRLTLSREGMPNSYHGNPSDAASDYVVWSEYGADAWKQVLRAGFAECRIFAFKYPSALALVAVP